MGCKKICSVLSGVPWVFTTGDQAPVGAGGLDDYFF